MVMRRLERLHIASAAPTFRSIAQSLRQLQLAVGGLQLGDDPHLVLQLRTHPPQSSLAAFLGLGRRGVHRRVALLKQRARVP